MTERLKPVIITFSGIDGSGKSTQIQKLREYLAGNGIAVRELTFWDNVVLFSGLRSGFSRHVLQSDGHVGTPDKPAERRDKNKQNPVLLLGRSVLHIVDLVNLRRIFRKLKSEPAGVIIFDRFMYDQLAALPMRSRIARAYARLLLKFAPKPDLALLLDAVPEVARARKPEYPLDFMREYRSSYLKLRDFTNLQLISPGEVDDVHRAIVSRFEHCVANATSRAELESALLA